MLGRIGVQHRDGQAIGAPAPVLPQSGRKALITKHAHAVGVPGDEPGLGVGIEAYRADFGFHSAPRPRAGTPPVEHRFAKKSYHREWTTTRGRSPRSRPPPALPPGDRLRPGEENAIAADSASRRSFSAPCR